MKTIIVKCIATAILMIIIVVLTLCLTSCVGQETWRITPKKAAVEQSGITTASAYGAQNDWLAKKTRKNLVLSSEFHKFAPYCHIINNFT